MKSHVTVKEMAGTKIIYAMLLACYYWMWARRDWHSFYDVIQNMVFLFTFLFFVLQAVRIRQYGKGEKDQAAIRNLRSIDAIGLKVMAGRRRYRLRVRHCGSRGKNRGLCAGRDDLRADRRSLPRTLPDEQKRGKEVSTWRRIVLWRSTIRAS